MKTFIVYHKTNGEYFTDYFKEKDIMSALKLFMQLNPKIRVFGIMEKQG